MEGTEKCAIRVYGQRQSKMRGDAVLDEPGEGGDLGRGAVVAQSLGGETVVVGVDRGDGDDLGRGAVVA